MKSRWIRRIGRIAAAGTLSAIVFVALSWTFIDWTDEGADKYAGGVILRDDAGNVLRVSLGEGDTDCRPFYVASRDDWIVKALVASEDGSFWSHHGVRPLSILRAACQNVFYGRRISGASTITMQAVRLIRPHPKTLWWKWKEAMMALKMERTKSKEWILSQYLNRAPYGSNLVGIEAAAQGWFGKGAKSLGLGEAAMLAGMVQAPSRFRPDRGYEKALKRRDYVLGRMQELGLATAAQVEGAKSVRPVICRAPRPFRCPYFCDWVMRSLGERAAGDVRTALNADVQLICENAVDAAAAKGGASVATVVMRVDTGEVVALACSGDYLGGADGQVNTALAPRPAGSTLKPFLTALGIEKGFVTPETRLADVPTAFKGYRPSNFDTKYRGDVTVRDALIQSLNIPFVRLLNRLGVESFGQQLRTLGFRNLGASDEAYGLGMAIGNVEVTLMELVSAYAVLARYGTTSDGTRVFAPGTAYLVSDMLSGNERSAAALGHVADVAASRFAWKTGTSSAYRDAWTVLWNPDYVVGVWCGHKRGGFGDRTVVGAKAAAPVAWGVARQLYPQNDGPWFVEPGDVFRRKVCALTGRPASADCPATVEGTAVRGCSLSVLCDRHRRNAQGEVITVTDKNSRLALTQPEDGATFKLVPGTLNQKIVCQPTGNGEGRLWWFVDGSLKGESAGAAPFALEVVAGEHLITCTTAAGDFASASIRVEAE